MHMSFYHVIITGTYIWAAILYYSLNSLETGLLASMSPVLRRITDAKKWSSLWMGWVIISQSAQDSIADLHI